MKTAFTSIAISAALALLSICPCIGAVSLEGSSGNSSGVSNPYNVTFSCNAGDLVVIECTDTGGVSPGPTVTGETPTLYNSYVFSGSLGGQSYYPAYVWVYYFFAQSAHASSDITFTAHRNSAGWLMSAAEVEVFSGAAGIDTAASSIVGSELPPDEPEWWNLPTITTSVAGDLVIGATAGYTIDDSWGAGAPSGYERLLPIDGIAPEALNVECSDSTFADDADVTPTMWGGQYPNIGLTIAIKPS